MYNILYTGLRKETLELIRQNLQQQDVAFQEVETIGIRKAAHTLHSHQALLVGEETENPIRVAQDVYVVDKNISILIISDGSVYTKIKQALQFAPFIGPTVQAFSSDVRQGLVPILEDAVQRSEQRRSYARLKATTSRMADFTANALEKVRLGYATRVLEEAPIGAALISGGGTVLTINAYAARLFRRSEKDILNTPFVALFPAGSQGEVYNFIEDAYLTEPKQVFELELEGQKQYLEISIATIHQSEVPGYRIAIINDITASVLAQQRTEAHLQELEKLNANLQRVNADLDTFVYTASHDLKSPILNIEGLVSMLEDSLGPAHASVALELEHIKMSVKRFKSTVEDLTEVARIQKNFDQEASLLEMPELFEEVRQLMQYEIAESGAILETDFSQAPLVNFSKKNMKSMIQNLVSNAIKYRAQERVPHIQIRTGMEGAYFCLTVKDNGLGIPKEKQDKVFQLFKRMHTHVQGSGVGLYIVKRVVENNGGQILVESEENKGTTFKVMLKV